MRGWKDDLLWTRHLSATSCGRCVPDWGGEETTVSLYIRFTSAMSFWASCFCAKKRTIPILLSPALHDQRNTTCRHRRAGMTCCRETTLFNLLVLIGQSALMAGPRML